MEVVVVDSAPAVWKRPTNRSWRWTGSNAYIACLDFMSYGAVKAVDDPAMHAEP
jgi:hypothetical protein